MAGKADAEIQRTHERHKTFRYLIVCITIILGIWVMSNAFVKIAGTPQPSWVTLVMSFFGIAGISYLPSRQWIGKIKLYMSKDHQRLRNFEATVDATRESSGLSPRGEAATDTM